MSENMLIWFKLCFFFSSSLGTAAASLQPVITLKCITITISIEIRSFSNGFIQCQRLYRYQEYTFVRNRNTFCFYFFFIFSTIKNLLRQKCPMLPKFDEYSIAIILDGRDQVAKQTSNSKITRNIGKKCWSDRSKRYKVKTKSFGSLKNILALINCICRKLQ